MIIMPFLPIIASLIAVLLPVVADLIAAILPILPRLIPVARRQLTGPAITGKSIVKCVTALAGSPSW
jgi:hypothetical protein